MKKSLALITGGSAGIGLEIAHLLAKDGYDLVITGSSNRIYAAADALRTHGGNVLPVQSDLSSEEGNRAVIDALASLKQAPDVVVLNAGIATGGKFDEIPLERHLQLIALNIISPVRIAHALIPDMVASGGGKFLLVSSLSAMTPTPYEGVYGPSKSFLSSFGHGIREELSGTGIQVTILHPGATATGFHASAGMSETAFGDNSWKNDPASVALQGYEAMKRGENSVVGGDDATHEAAGELLRLSDEEKARRHAAMTRPRK